MAKEQANVDKTYRAVIKITTGGKPEFIVQGPYNKKGTASSRVTFYKKKRYFLDGWVEEGLINWQRIDTHIKDFLIDLK